MAAAKEPSGVGAGEVTGPSMIPTFDLTGNLVLVDCISRRLDKLSHGYVVLLRSPENPKKILTKRLIGMEGDRMIFNFGPGYSDNCESVVLQVPKGHVWVQEDNIYDSWDSRQFGAVPYALLQGRVFWKVLPLKDFGPL